MISTPAVDVPLQMDNSGVFHIGSTRVTLDSVIYSFRQGATPETIADQFPVLSLADVYLVLGYYLQQREAVDSYLRQQESEAEQIEHDIAKQFPQDGIRDRLLARLKANQHS